MSGLVVGVTLIGAGLLIAGVLVSREARRKHVRIWLRAYLKQRWRHAGVRKRAARLVPLHILFCLVDHFEPISANSTREQERERMRDWLDRYPKLASRHHDSDGRPPQHTW